MPADFGRILVGPGAFAQHASSLGGPGFGNGTLLAALARGVFRGNQPQDFHPFSWVLKTREVAHFGHYGDGHGALHTAQGLQGIYHRTQAPSFDLHLQLLVQTSKTCGGCVPCTDIFLEDALLSGRWTTDCREPSEVGRAPIGPASGADGLSEPEGFETELGVLESADGIFP